MYISLCNKLKAARENSKLSRKQVSELIGVSESMIGHYETGERQPSLSVLVKLAKQYKTSTDYLLGNNVIDNNTIALDGLSDKQKQVIRDTIECFRDMTHN